MPGPVAPGNPQRHEKDSRPSVPEPRVRRRRDLHPLEGEEPSPAHVQPDAAEPAVVPVVALELGEAEHLAVEPGHVLQSLHLDRQVVEPLHVHPGPPGLQGATGPTGRASTTSPEGTRLATGIAGGGGAGLGRWRRQLAPSIEHQRRERVEADKRRHRLDERHQQDGNAAGGRCGPPRAGSSGLQDMKTGGEEAGRHRRHQPERHHRAGAGEQGLEGRARGLAQSRRSGHGGDQPQLEPEGRRRDEERSEGQDQRDSRGAEQGDHRPAEHGRRAARQEPAPEPGPEQLVEHHGHRRPGDAAEPGPGSGEARRRRAEPGRPRLHGDRQDHRPGQRGQEEQARRRHEEGLLQPERRVPDEERHRERAPDHLRGGEDSGQREHGERRGHRGAASELEQPADGSGRRLRGLRPGHRAASERGAVDAGGAGGGSDTVLSGRPSVGRPACSRPPCC